MSLTHALLGLLIVEPRSGYELTKAFERDLGRFAWQAGHTSIYPELNKMADAGLVEVTHEGARGSRTYAATDAGRGELRRWMFDAGTTNAKVRDERTLRMFMISALDPDDAVTYLRGVAEATGARAAELREIREKAGPVVRDGRVVFGLLAAEYGLRQFEVVHGWAEWAVEQLESADRQPAAHHRT